eukprot:scaffold1340_cov253-Pinguiococcus_pyrenoidosus.AAC.27
MVFAIHSFFSSEIGRLPNGIHVPEGRKDTHPRRRNRESEASLPASPHALVSKAADRHSTEGPARPARGERA